MLRRLGPGLRLAALLGSTAVLGSVAWAQGTAGFDGRYTGELTLTRVIDGDCTRPPLGAVYPLTIARGQVRFAYVSRFGTVLNGTVGADGAFIASARLKRGSVQMSGQIRGSRLTATILSPSCQDDFRAQD